VSWEKWVLIAWFLAVAGVNAARAGPDIHWAARWGNISIGLCGAILVINA
jgi:hypothetical protein